VRSVPFWLDTFPKSRRRSYPRLRGEHQASIVVVGGGLTGVACAYAFAAADVDVVLVEADVIGNGATAGSSGLLRDGFGGSVQESVARHGVGTTRALWEGMRKGSLEFASVLRRLAIRCDLQPMDILTVAGANPAAVKQLKREQSTRRDLGADAAWLSPAAAAREAALDTGGAIRTRGAAIDPLRACVGLAAAAAARGARLHERTVVRRIKPSSRFVEVVCNGASVRADAVVVATGAPLPDLRGLRRHLDATSEYAAITEPLPAVMRRQVGRRAAAVEDAAAPHRLVRWIPGDRIMIRGGRQPQVAPRLRGQVLVQRTGQIMYELSLLYPAVSGIQPVAAWDSVDYETVDGLPFVGLHRNYPRHLFAFTPSRHGAGLAWTAARLLVRRYQQAAARADEAFGFARIL